MSHLADHWALPWLATLADWSIRWGVVLAALAAWLALRPPRRAATRHLLCLSALVAGVLLPVAPRWGDAVVPWPARGGTAVAPTPRAHPGTVGVSHGLPPEPDAPGRPTQLRDASLQPRPALAASPPLPVRPIPPPPPLGAWRLATLVAAGAWAAVVLSRLVRLACGWLMLSRLRRGAVELGPGSGRLLGECRSALGLSRPAGLAVHPAVASPVAIGGLSPLVLVPPDWGDWPEPHRRACLLHELAHLARRDDWARLAQELIRAPFFFHPLVLWLLARLDREREILCDEAAVARGADPVAYARMLFDLARRPGRLSAATPASRLGWLPFLDRCTVKARIERLLEDDMRTTLSRPSPARSFLLGGVALLTALACGGLRVRAGSAATDELPKPAGAPRDAEAPAPAKPPAPAAVEEMSVEAPRELKGVILDPEGHPVPGATLVAGSYDPGRSGHQVVPVDAEGRFTWMLPRDTRHVCLVAYKDGLAAGSLGVPAPAMSTPLDLKLRLGKPGPFAALLVDGGGKPVSGAKVRIETIARSAVLENSGGSAVSTCFEQVPRAVVEGSPVDDLFVATTDASGAFTFRSLASASGLKLVVTAADGRVMRVKPATDAAGPTGRAMQKLGYVTAPPGEPTRIVAVLAARVSGRVLSRLPGVEVSGLTAFYQESHQSGVMPSSGNTSARASAGPDGRFTFEGLAEGTVNVFVHGPGENKEWTYRAAKDVTLTAGGTAEVTIELIRGIEVAGTIVAKGTGLPVEGAKVGVYGPFRPRTGAMTTGAKADARGRYRYRLPSGETYFYVMGPPDGFTRLPEEKSSRTVTIPDGASVYEVPPIELAAAVTVRGRVVDAAGRPVTGATVVGLCEGGRCRPFEGTEALTDARGAFRLPRGLNNVVAIGKPATLLIRLRGGAEHEASAVPDSGGAVVVKLPVGGEALKGVEGPRDVAPDELAGVVVDADGRPIEGAEVDVWTWYPGNEAKTDSKGFFRIKVEKEDKVEVVICKEGYAPHLSLKQPAGKPGWVVVLGDKTYFEGWVKDPDGKPAAGVRLRANRGPKAMEGGRIQEIWTEATTGDDGRYRMYAQADVYDIQVRAPGVGVARLAGTSLEADEAKRLDVALVPGVAFRAKFVDSLTGKPVSGVRLWHWQQPGIEGRSDTNGLADVPEMIPGVFHFDVEAPGYARWWSDEGNSQWSRRQVLDSPRGGWQRNFDDLDFDLKPGMGPVTITVERGVTVTGRVLDPDGKPVAGATVAPAMTGSNNSLTGDTRFSVETGADGVYTTILPAGGGRDYNLMAHDGKYEQWRTWANGVLPPIRTRPGETLANVDLHLTRPATVRGRVTDAEGRPVAGIEVRASAADRWENRYYEPAVKTTDDGRYELKFIRPGEQFIHFGTVWYTEKPTPSATNRNLTVAPGEVKEGVDFRLRGDDAAN